MIITGSIIDADKLQNQKFLIKQEKEKLNLLDKFSFHFHEGIYHLDQAENLFKELQKELKKHD